MLPISDIVFPLERVMLLHNEYSDGESVSLDVYLLVFLYSFINMIIMPAPP